MAIDGRTLQEVDTRRGSTSGRTRFRLGVDFHVWDGIFQGSRSHILGLYRAAIGQAPDMDFVFFLNDTAGLRAAHPEFAAPNVELVHMPNRHGLWRLTVQLPWLRWRHRVDLLHLQYRLPIFAAGPCACTIHDLLFETHPDYFPRSFVMQSRLMGRVAARNARLLFAVSEFTRDEIVRIYGIDSSRIAITRNGVDRSRFFAGDADADVVRALGLMPGRYLLTVGRLEPRKNHITLLRAYAQMADPPPLLIVGQRDFAFGEVFEALDRSELHGRVRVLECVSDDVLPALMRHAQVFVYPAFAEGFGMPVAEALASGVPVVTSDTTSLPEVGGPGVLKVDPHDAQALAAAVQLCVSNTNLRQQMVADGLRHVNKFDWNQSAQILLSRIRSTYALPGTSPLTGG